ncbi:MAG: hypothetical protein LBU76_00160 [Azoarcus sp.]|jgi:hypothetical protein|nr:hypothetical protein [Azoarcus sp.]
MDLKTLHLEETVVLPENYGEVIANPREITPEMMEQGYFGGEFNRLYNMWMKDFDPFTVQIMEHDFQKDDVDNNLDYLLRFDADNSAFAPLLRFIIDWGEQNVEKGAPPNRCFGEWLHRQMEYSEKSGFEIITPKEFMTVTFLATGETAFVRMLEDVSACFRTLATEHSGEPLYLAVEEEEEDTEGCISIHDDYEFEDSGYEGEDYSDVANGELTPAVRMGLLEGLAAFRRRVESGETDETEINIEIDREKETMQFYCPGDVNPFYEFELGEVLSWCISYIENDFYLVYEEELSHWFEDAVAGGLPEEAYKGLNVTIEVPEVGGDPYLEHFE